MALHQPLAIGEAPGEGPNSVAIAQAIADFARRSDLFTYCQNPPYSATSYIKAFTGSPPSAALTVSVRRNVVELRDPYDLPVTARVIGYGELVRAPRRAERGTPRLVRPALAGVPVPAATLSQFQVLMPNLRVRTWRDLPSKSAAGSISGRSTARKTTSRAIAFVAEV